MRLRRRPDGISVVPLKFKADATLIYSPPMLLLRLAADLPAPVPLANSGLGLFGVGGLFGIAARPVLPPGADPVMGLLQWNPNQRESYAAEPGQFTFGLEAVVGTLPDLGFSFSSKAGVLVSAPALSVRAGLNGRVLHPVMSISDPTMPPDDQRGIAFLGLMGLDAQALNLAVLGRVNLRPASESLATR